MGRENPGAGWKRRTLNVVLLLLPLGGGPLFAIPVGLRVNSLPNPLGIDTPKPVLSWQSNDTGKNWVQAAYRVEVASNPSLLETDRPDVWDSGRVASGESVGIVYGGPALAASKRYFWRVRTWDGQGREQASTEAA